MPEAENKMDTPFIQDQLPEPGLLVGMGNGDGDTYPLQFNDEDVHKINESFSALLVFAAGICNVPKKELTRRHLIRFTMGQIGGR